MLALKPRCRVARYLHRVARLPVHTRQPLGHLCPCSQVIANLIWKIADLLRGPYQPNQYGEPSKAPGLLTPELPASPPILQRTPEDAGARDRRRVG